MRHGIQWMKMLSLTVLLGVLLSACGTAANVVEPSATATASEKAEPSTRMYTDLMGRKVEIPVLPQNIVYYGGNTYGDILALGVQPIGADGRYFKDSMTVYPEKFAGTQDLGFPLNLEKLTELDPDLVIMSVFRGDEELEKIAKVAPVIIIDPDASLEERLLALGDLIGKTKEAQAWIASYEAKAEQTWKTINESAHIGADETASVFMYAYEKNFYVMARGLTSTLYLPSGFKPQEAVQEELLKKNEPFLEISHELLPEYAGDRIFLIVSDETSEAANELLNSALWKNIAAVKNGFVYKVESKLSLTDAMTRSKLLDELPAILAAQ